MNSAKSTYDFIVVGGGPAGQNAALEAAKQGSTVAIVEREVEIGGACVQYGTIPSKTLRETAMTLAAFKRRSGDVFEISSRGDLQIDSLMTRLDQVISAHHQTSQKYLDNAHVERIHGLASFVSPNTLNVQDNFGDQHQIAAKTIVLATGSHPRNPAHIDVDHENIFDSDSILSMNYLPQSLTVFGGGVIACEYASVFASLGVKVVIVDRYPSPLGFLDPELVTGFVSQLERNGGEFRGPFNIESVKWDGVSSVTTTLENGDVIHTDKAFAAFGRVANTDRLNLAAAGLKATDSGLVAVNEYCQTEVPHIYAVGDMIGPPALASTSMEQGRRAVTHALGFTPTTFDSVIPMGIYTIPELSCIGMTESQAIAKLGGALVARVKLTDLSRGQIMAVSDGLLKLVSDVNGSKILGVQIFGDGATELIHLGQMAIQADFSIEQLANSIFNFPTLAEAYRLAALEIIRQTRRPVNSSQDSECGDEIESAFVPVSNAV